MDAETPRFRGKKPSLYAVVSTYVYCMMKKSFILKIIEEKTLLLEAISKYIHLRK